MPRSSKYSPNEDAIKRLIGAVLLEQNDEWQTQNRHVHIEGFAEPAAPAIDQAPLQITPKAAWRTVLRGRPLALKRAYANLIGNAVKYGGSADVTVNGSAHEITVTIADHRPGIPPEKQMHRVRHHADTVFAWARHVLRVQCLSAGSAMQCDGGRNWRC